MISRYAASALSTTAFVMESERFASASAMVTSSTFTDEGSVIIFCERSMALSWSPFTLPSALRRRLPNVCSMPPPAAGGVEQKFGDLLLGALGNVNDSQLKAMDLSQRMITDPGSVNVEDVTIALADANLALSMTKSIVDRALAAYREIINMR